MITKYRMIQIELNGSVNGNPFIDTQLSAQFCSGALTYDVPGFYDGDGRYLIRFLPMNEGKWSYKTSSNQPELDGIEGDFECAAALSGDHGPVRVKESHYFSYDDGLRFLPFGTTAYAWTSQDSNIIEQTIETLRLSPFNKIRMSPLPKHYEYNYNEPELFPFEGGATRTPEDPSGKRNFTDSAYHFDFTRPNIAYWQRFDRCVEACLEMGIECDLIFFYAYDRWGFAHMGRENNLHYIRYVVSRYCSYPNIWWSMANEWDIMGRACPNFEIEDWELYAAEVQKHDYIGHLNGIHNMTHLYDQSRPWITHVSVQKNDHYSHITTKTDEYMQFGKPVVWDEVCYEGNLEAEFGNISGEEMTMRFWEAFMRGAYCTHGETYHRDDDVIWWAKGGWLEGTSPARIRFMRELVETLPGDAVSVKLGPPHCCNALLYGEKFVHQRQMFGMTIDEHSAEYMLYYLNFTQPQKFTLDLKNNLTYTAEIIDTWNMTVHKVPGIHTGKVSLKLPGRPYMAVLLKKI